MSNKKDASGFTPQQRHQIIVDYLKKVNKPTKVFHLRWKPGELLTGKVLESTPMFWYMKYQWSRSEIEEMFYKARCVIGPLFDQALQQTYGGSPGPRWRGAVPEKEKSKWRQRQAEKLAGWQAEQAEKLKRQEEEERQRKLQEAQRKAEEERLRKEAEKTLAYKSKDIWNAVSDFGADKSIDYKTFSENLRDRGINVSPLLAKQLFDQLGGPGGKLTRQEMDQLIKKLDQMNNSVTVTWDMLGDKLGCQTIMKRVLLAAGAGTPFNVDDFVFAQKFGVSISPIQYMNKLSNRDVPWDDRMRAMEQLGANLGTNPLFNNVLAKGNIPELLCGWATQVLDNKPEVQKTAIDTLPAVFHNAMEFGDKDIAVGYLEEVLDNLFKVLDDPNARKNHKPAKDAIAKIVEDVLKNGDPEAILFVSGILAEKCDIENANNPQTRETALANLQTIMFGDKNPIKKSLQDKNKKEPPTNLFPNLPPKGTVNREWLDIATNKKEGPSSYGFDDPEPSRKGPKSYTDSERSPMGGKRYPNQQIKEPYKEQKYAGDGPEETFESLPLAPRDPAGPVANVTSNPSTARIKQPVNFDASKSHDCDNEPCKTFLWDFGDGTPKVTTKGPYTQHPYEYPGAYPVTVTVTDKYGKTADAMLQQRVIDPKNPKEIGPPYAQLTGKPDTTKVGQMATFDASKSHDYQNKPCQMFVFDFGDGTMPVHSKSPVVKHAYEQRGAYPVTCDVTDKYGQKAKASCQHRVIDPELPDPTGPVANVTSTPLEALPNQPVTFDASKSKDCDGDPVKTYTWDFGDGTKPVTTNKPEIVHKYPKSGSYPVKCTVTDKYGKKANAGLTQRVKDPKNPSGPPCAELQNKPPESDIDEPVTFDASKSHDFKGNPCTKFVWEFGDNTPKVTTNTPITQHPYSQPGSFPVKVTVYDKQGKPATASVNQRVRPPEQPYNASNNEPNPYGPPGVSVSSTPPDAKPKQPVKFDASKSKDFEGNPCKKFLWDFGDGTSPVETTTPYVNHPYDEPGTYPVRVTATDKYGQKGNAKLSQRVTDPKNPNKPEPPYAHVRNDPPISNPKQPVKFDASKSHDQFNKPCVKFLWDFGDGTPKVTTTIPMTKHPYANPGAYPVTVTVTDKNGLSSQAGCTQKVRTPSKPEPEDPYVAISSIPPDAKPKEPVRFDASKSVDQDGDPCKTFLWDFGDGTPPQTTTTPITNHAYDNPGSYPVKVTAFDKYGRKGNADLTQKVIDPKNPNKIGPPYASLKSAPQESLINQPVYFDASESKDFQGGPCKSFYWNFGDNTPRVTTKEPYTTHPYKKEGTYPVTVEVTDKHNQKAKASVNQRVRKPDPEDPYVALNNEPPESRPKQPVKFDASKSIDMDGEPCKNFVYDFGDGTPPIESTSPIINHAYDEPGTYPVTVTATDKYGRKGNATVNQRVIDPKNPKKKMPPVAKLTSTPPDAKPKQPVKFDASKSHDGDKKPCVKFVWDFGDGTPKVTTKTPITNHPYARPGAYPVTVQVTDKDGQTANAGLTQRVSDPAVYDDDPSRGPRAPKNKNYGGKKGKGTKSPDPAGNRWNSSGNNKKQPPPNRFKNEPPEEKGYPDKPDDDIGDEFRNVVHDAVSKAIMDPNPKNQTVAAKTATIMSKLDPSFMNSLDPEAKKRYEWGLKPTKPYPEAPKKQLPKFEPGKKALHGLQSDVFVDVDNPILPDI